MVTAAHDVLCLLTRTQRGLDAYSGHFDLLAKDWKDALAALGARGDQRLLAEGAERAFVLECGEGPEGRLKIARKGLGRFVLTVRGRSSECALAEMGRCLSPCDGSADPATYAAVVRQLRDTLLRRPDEVVAAINTRMAALAADELDVGRVRLAAEGDRAAGNDTGRHQHDGRLITPRSVSSVRQSRRSGP